MRRTVLLAIVFLFASALTSTVLPACGNGANLPAWFPAGVEVIDGMPTLLPPDSVVYCPAASGQTVYVCEAEFHLATTTTMAPDTCALMMYTATCQSGSIAAKVAVQAIAYGIMKASAGAVGFVRLDCIDTGSRTWTKPNLAAEKPNRAPGHEPQGEDAGIVVVVDGGGSSSPPSTWPVGVDPPGQGTCPDTTGRAGWVELDNPDLNAGPSCSVEGTVSTCTTCAATSCCAQRTACDGDDAPGKPGSCGCWSACESAGFSTEQCGQPVDPSGPSSCGPQDAITSAYDACLHLECPSCGPSGVEPVGVHVGYLGAAAQ